MHFPIAVREEIDTAGMREEQFITIFKFFCQEANCNNGKCLQDLAVSELSLEGTGETKRRVALLQLRFDKSLGALETFDKRPSLERQGQRPVIR
jgi:hypothetical protein